MRKLFEYLKANCSDTDSLLRVEHQELWFGFNHFQIIFEFSDLNRDDFHDSHIDVSDVDFSFLQTQQINRIFIQKSNSLLEDDDLEKEYLSKYEPLTYQMYDTIKRIKENFSDSIYDYSIKPFCIDDCGWEYGYQIDINKSYWTNKEFYQFIIDVIDKRYFNMPIPSFYDTQKELKDIFEIKSLNTNTKIRRLGYLKILLKMMSEQPKVPISRMNNIFEVFSNEYKYCLEQHKNQKGEIIITKSGNSANPYIELALNLGLLRKTAGIYEVGKFGKVYNILKNKIDSSEGNPFILSKFDTTFFLEILLKEDYWFLYEILKQTAINPNIAYKTLKVDFQQILLRQIKDFIDDAQIKNSRQVLSLKVRERRIKNWSKPKVYIEHVLMPRLNWLYDLNFIELKNNLSFHLTEMGERLLFNLSIWNDMALHQIVSPLAYIDNFYMKMMDYVFETQNQNCTKEADNFFMTCIDDSFVLFKTLAPNRITFSSFANYTKHILFWKHSVLIDTENIKNAFELKRVERHILKYQEQYQDGYIQRN
jgi:hypothetical protein